MKKGFVFLMVLCTALIAVSCGDKTKSYTQLLKANNKAIDRLISENRFEILSDFPKDSIFAANEFVKLESGVYLNIMDKGSERRAELGKTVVYARFKVRGLIAPDTALVNTLDEPYGQVAEFTYGNYSFTDVYSIEYAYIGEGVGEILQYVGDGAHVKLIVPFKVGSQTDQSSGQPRYFEDLRYKFELEPDPE